MPFIATGEVIPTSLRQRRHHGPSEACQQVFALIASAFKGFEQTLNDFSEQGVADTVIVLGQAQLRHTAIGCGLPDVYLPIPKTAALGLLACAGQWAESA